MTEEQIKNHNMTQDMTIEQFCTKHYACKEGREWALASCSTMKEVWEKAKPAWLIWVATRPSVLTGKELRLFAVFCARQVQHLMTDPRSIEAINVAEKYAQGKASDVDLSTANAAAWAANADAAARAAARAAANAAYAAARAAANAAYAASYAARAASYASYAAYAASYAAYAAASAAANAAARAANADAAARAANADAAAWAAWLRENIKPNFL